MDVYATLGQKGHNVIKVQRALNKNAGKKIVKVSGVFDQATKEAVIDFQKSRGLRPDGVVETICILMLLKSERELSVDYPPKVKQKNDKYCWAAATESYRKSRPILRNYTQDEIVGGAQEDGYARSDGALIASKQAWWEEIHGLNPIKVKSSKFYVESAYARLKSSGYPLLIGIKSKGEIGHVMVMFAIKLKDDIAAVYYMDPWVGDYKFMRIKNIHKEKKDMTTWLYKYPLLG